MIRAALLLITFINNMGVCLASPPLPHLRHSSHAYAIGVTDFDQEPDIIEVGSRAPYRLPRIPVPTPTGTEGERLDRVQHLPAALCAITSCLQLLCGACCLGWLFTQSQ